MKRMFLFALFFSVILSICSCKKDEPSSDPVSGASGVLSGTFYKPTNAAAVSGEDVYFGLYTSSACTTKVVGTNEMVVTFANNVSVGYSLGTVPGGSGYLCVLLDMDGNTVTSPGDWTFNKVVSVNGNTTANVTAGEWPATPE